MAMFVGATSPLDNQELVGWSCDPGMRRRSAYRPATTRLILPARSLPNHFSPPFIFPNPAELGRPLGRRLLRGVAPDTTGTHQRNEGGVRMMCTGGFSRTNPTARSLTDAEILAKYCPNHAVTRRGLVGNECPTIKRSHTRRATSIARPSSTKTSKPALQQLAGNPRGSAATARVPATHVPPLSVQSPCPPTRCACPSSLKPSPDHQSAIPHPRWCDRPYFKHPSRLNRILAAQAHKTDAFENTSTYRYNRQHGAYQGLCLGST